MFVWGGSALNAQGDVSQEADGSFKADTIAPPLLGIRLAKHTATGSDRDKQQHTHRKFTKFPNMRKVSNLASSRNWGRFFWKLESPVTMV